MSVNAKSLTERVQEMPRALQWLGLALIGTLLFTVWSYWVQPLNEDLRDQANRVERRVAEVSDAPKLARQLQGMKDTIASVGPVEVPATAEAAMNQLQTIVNDLLRRHPRVTKDDFSSRPEGKLRRGALEEVARGRRIETIRGNLKFEAPPEDAVAMVAAIEANPAIERVTNLQLDRIGGGRLRVQMSFESWVLGTDA